jgi:hypothetical protein
MSHYFGSPTRCNMGYANQNYTVSDILYTNLEFTGKLNSKPLHVSKLTVGLHTETESFVKLINTTSTDGYRGEMGAAAPPPAPASTFCYRGSTAREAVQIFGGTGTHMYSPLFRVVNDTFEKYCRYRYQLKKVSPIYQYSTNRYFGVDVNVTGDICRCIAGIKHRNRVQKPVTCH